MIKVTFEKDYSKDFNIKFYGWIQLNIVYENRKLLLGEIGKTEKRLNTQYRYRVYNEDELREKMEA